MNVENDNKIINFRYILRSQSGSEYIFNINLDRETLNIIDTKKDNKPDWARMEYFRCPHCTLDVKDYEYCPLALNLTDIVSYFSNSLSYEPVDVTLYTKERIYSKHTSLQEAISSIIGIYMVSSGCPILEKLKPLVRFHIPFANAEETRYRVISMYIFAQYFIMRRGEKPDWELKGLIKIYEDIRKVNQNFCDKLGKSKIKDASLNAFVKLDAIALNINFLINEDLIENLQSIFKGLY